jgi:hypothetical protein
MGRSGTTESPVFWRNAPKNAPNSGFYRADCRFFLFQGLDKNKGIIVTYESNSFKEEWQLS